MKQQRVSENKPSVGSLHDGSHMDIVMIQALLQSLFSIFTTMVRLNIRAGIPVPKQDKMAKGAVSGLIGMTTDGACGSIALSLTLPTVREISRSLLGHEISNIDSEAADLAGELANMLVGGAKSILSEKGHDFDMQTPQLLLGDRHEIVHHYQGQTVLLPIQIERDEFYIELNFI